MFKCYSVHKTEVYVKVYMHADHQKLDSCPVFRSVYPFPLTVSTCKWYQEIEPRDFYAKVVLKKELSN